MIFASDHQRLNKSSLLATSMRLLKKIDRNERTVIPYGSFCLLVTPLSASLAFHHAINTICYTVIPFLWLLYATITLLCCAVLCCACDGNSCARTRVQGALAVWALLLKFLPIIHRVVSSSHWLTVLLSWRASFYCHDVGDISVVASRV